ncbi:hypothetical protein BS47DRAFT_1420870 [Hydnum rufescens UP504]|uniref:Malonyl-CoA:ACP transacylase (MAT) domain-containing protein n=1 Tax=Hydnum rufescens UP504 TaxID=1448309 RepID=A0A9P6B656_9AGAM|nr:hypothetical protein BS47DRAFT_1420870 [Hydnum rufescens UP504]
MGMDLYSSSPTAWAVWDGANEHLLAIYGFSIIELVKQNPKQKTIHFSGIKGQAIRQCYIDMTYDTMDKDGNVKTLPLFADINNRTPKYTFSHPSGLLFTTQFMQIALVITEKAAFDNMHSKDLVQPNCAFASHSLREYSALASIADVLPVSSLVDVVFYRGITMQHAMECDAHNRSNYAMCAVNPSCISKTFNEVALHEVVEVIAHHSNVLLEIVIMLRCNFGSQYVCTGDLLALQSLMNVLNYLKKENIDIQKTYSVDRVKETLQEIVDNCIKAAHQKQEADDGYIVLKCGFTTIPLPGIDVPFHSQYLWAGVMPF